MIMHKQTRELPGALPGPGAASTPDVKQATATRRRLVFLILNLVTIALLTLGMVVVLSSGGITLVKSLMLLAYLMTIPWLSIGFWNAVIGYIMVARRKNLSQDGALQHHEEKDPWALRYDETATVSSRTAITMAVRNEDPDSAILRLRVMHDDLHAQGFRAEFDFHVLSDTSDPQIARREEQLVDDWRRASTTPQQIHYRRRTENTGYKAGNIREFCERTVDQYDFFIPLDADSLMSGAAVLRVVRMMEANPEVGILQTLVTGTPASTFFARAFQFGMRHGMRAYTKGSAWWQCDCGPYWGHNAVVRMRPFHDHCVLPVLPGKGPLSGHVMSHDQVEAVLIRKAGYHVRVLTDEFESWEENPPTLPDFIRRELRWCQGNMQYWHLLTLPGLLIVSRLQLSLAILMFISSFGWMSLILLGFIEIMTTNYINDYPVWLGLTMFVIIMTMNLAPKFCGLANVIASRPASQQYGGRGRALISGLCELPFSFLLAPIVSFAITIFIVGLIFGKKIDWRVQRRSARSVAWLEAIRSYWPQTLLGFGIILSLGLYIPIVLPWSAPVLAGFAFSIPFAMLTTSHTLSSWSVRNNIFSIPEDYNVSSLLDKVMLRDAKPGKKQPAKSGTELVLQS